MIPAGRLIFYVCIGALLWIGAAVNRGFVIVALLYDLLLVLAALVDWYFAPRADEFEIEREMSEKMNLGASNRVVLRVRSRARFGVEIAVRDEPPAVWPVALPQDETQNQTHATRVLEGKTLDKIVGDVAPEQAPEVARVTISLQSGQSGEGFYFITPTRRGDWEFGDVSARYNSPLGLWHRQFRRKAPARVRVYPDTEEVRRYELLLRQGRLRDIGLHILRLRGRGTEFESLREYSRDDEYRDVNWKASARLGKMVVNNYQIERDQTIIIALDCGRMMTAMAHFSTTSNKEKTPLSKLDCAINATVLLSHVASSMGDAVGLLLFSDEVQTFLPPRKGRVQTGRIIEAMYGAQPTLVEPDYQAAYQHLLSRRLRRALVVTFTDLIDPQASAELLSASGALRRHHNALCVTINNRDVLEMAEAMPEHSAELYRKAMAQRMLSHRARALEELRRNGVGILDVDAAALTVAAVNRYLDLKARAAL